MSEVKQTPTKKETQSPNANPRQEGPWGVSFVLALCVHTVLFVGLFVVFQWNRESSEVVYAELWAPSSAPQGTVAPVPEEPKDDVTPEPEPEPEPEPGSSVSVQEIKAIPVIAIAKRPDKR